MGIKKVMVHTASIVRNVVPASPFGDLVDGDRGAVEADVLSFPCLLILPEGTETPTGRGRRVTAPTLLYEPYVGAEPVALKAQDELHIIAREQNVAQGLPELTEVRWTVQTVPQTLGRPGKRVKAVQATLQRVDD
jgi:hypothetical protein